MKTSAHIPILTESQQQEMVFNERFELYKNGKLNESDSWLQKFQRSLSSSVYSDEQEYLDDPKVPLKTRLTLVGGLSRLNDRSGYTKIFLKELRELIPQRKEPVKIVDIGAGGGSLLAAIYQYAQKEGFAVDLYGVDLSSDFAQKTQFRLTAKKVPVKMMQGDATNLLKIADESFDIAVSSYMTHHIRSAYQVGLFLHEIYRITKKGWLIADFDRRVYGPLFVGLSASLMMTPRLLISDGIKSLKRAYTTDEMNFIMKEIAATKELRGMSCQGIPFFPYWKIKGRKWVS